MASDAEPLVWALSVRQAHHTPAVALLTIIPRYLIRFVSAPKPPTSAIYLIVPGGFAG